MVGLNGGQVFKVTNKIFSWNFNGFGITGQR